jgi:hypothetical protein
MGDNETTPERIAMHTAAKAFVRRWLGNDSEGVQRTAIQELYRLLKNVARISGGEPVCRNTEDPDGR